jgi:hypothetical protein
VRPFRSSRLHMWILHSHPPITDKPPRGWMKRRGAGTPGVRYRACIPCIHSSITIGMGVIIPLSFIQSRFIYTMLSELAVIPKVCGFELHHFWFLFLFCWSLWLVICIHRRRRSGGVLSGWRCPLLQIHISSIVVALAVSIPFRQIYPIYPGGHPAFVRLTSRRTLDRAFALDLP